MSHASEKAFCLYVKNKFPEYFKDKRVLDCGSLDINGNNRYLFENCEYIGIDIGKGKNVDIITPIHEFKSKNNFDTIISTECFEHDMYYQESIKNIYKLLKNSGLFIFTCATKGRSEHGTINFDADSSPLTSSINKWNTYYKNLTEIDIRKIANIDEIFLKYEFSLENDHHDLYFWGIKK